MIELQGKMVAVRPVYDNDKIGSLYIPDQAKDRCDQGIIKYFGPKCNTDWRVGDFIIFSGYTGAVVDLEDEGRFIIMHERYIQAIIYPADTEIQGLYFRSASSDSDEALYFPATLEQSIELISRSITDAEWFKSVKNGKRAFNVITKPEVSEYEEED